MLTHICQKALCDNDYLKLTSDIFSHKLFQSMANYMQHGSTTAKDHCINVSYLSYKLCRKLHLNYIAVARSGLLHDFFLYDWHTHYKNTGLLFHGFTHPRTALNNALENFRLSNLEQDIILKHMWPLTVVPPKHPEGFIITIIDKFCSFAEFFDNKLYFQKKTER